MMIPIEISARHIHLSQADLETLFGPGYELKKQRDLSQIGEFAAEEHISLIGEKGELNVRIIGPIREQTQIEITLTEARILGVQPVLRLSGNLADSAEIRISGPQGEIKLLEGVIVPLRHIHISNKEVEKLGLTNGQKVKVKIGGVRGGILDQIIVRSGENFRLALHLDTDEANALGIDQENNHGELIID